MRRADGGLDIYDLKEGRERDPQGVRHYPRSVRQAARRSETGPLCGHSLVPALEGWSVRDGVLTAVESIVTLDADFWRGFADDDALAKLISGELRPSWDHRGFLRGYTDQRYTFGRYFAPLEPNRPSNPEQLQADNDVVLYDRVEDPHELVNLAADPVPADLVNTYRGKLEALISDEIGADDTPWVTERPNLLGWPTWHGDRVVTGG